jgi:HEAT repeat protein
VLPGQALRSINLFRRLQRIDPMIDVRLAQRLPDRSGSNHAIAFTSRNSARALDLLDQTSPGRRLLPVIGHLIDSPDQQICAKAALLIGRRVQSPDWVERQLERGDERVRANAIESIWGVNTTEARTLLEKYVTDSNNRVAGNALVGLHIVGEPGILAHVEKMAHDATPGFRATAAWAMGRMADGRFIGELTTLLKDEDQVVRSAALRSMIELRRTTDMLAADQASKIEEREQAEETPLLIVEPTEAEETPAEQPAPVVFDIKLDGSSFSSSRGSGAYRQ